MEMEIVSFEQAKALKELGFPQNIYAPIVYTSKVYLEKTIPHDVIAKECGLSDWQCIGGKLIPCSSDYDEYGVDTCSCPTLELVAKWLRDEKHLSITISWMPNIKKYSCICGDMNYIPKEHSYSESYRMYNEKFTVIKDGNSRFDSYEEAMSAGIDKAIETLQK